MDRIDWARFRRALRTVVVIVILLWAIEIVDLVTPFGTLDRYGIRPRSLAGLINIPVAPLLHAGFGHLLANTVPLLLLGTLVCARGAATFTWDTGAALVVSGLGVWLFGGTNTLHLGASGVVFGYLGYLVAAAWWERSPRSIIVAVAVAILYGGLLPGVLPGQVGISWLAHLFGLLGGILAANLISSRWRASGR